MAASRQGSDTRVPAIRTVDGASLGGLAGCVLGAAGGYGVTMLAMHDPSGLEALMPVGYALYSAALGILVGGFVGYWLAIRLRGGRANPVSLGLLAGLMTLGALAAVVLVGPPYPLDIDSGWLSRWIDPEWFEEWAVLALLVLPGPAALLAHRLGDRLSS